MSSLESSVAGLNSSHPASADDSRPPSLSSSSSSVVPGSPLSELAANDATALQLGKLHQRARSLLESGDRLLSSAKEHARESDASEAIRHFGEAAVWMLRAVTVSPHIDAAIPIPHNSGLEKPCRVPDALLMSRAPFSHHPEVLTSAEDHLAVQAMYCLQKAVHEYTCRSPASHPAIQYVQEPIQDSIVTELERLPVGDVEEEGVTQILQTSSHPLTVARTVCALALRISQSVDKQLSIQVSCIANEILSSMTIPRGSAPKDVSTAARGVSEFPDIRGRTTKLKLDFPTFESGPSDPSDITPSTSASPTAISSSASPTTVVDTHAHLTTTTSRRSLDTPRHGRYPRRNRSRASSLVPLSLAFSPPTSPQISPPSSPVASTRSMFSRVPSRPHTLFSLPSFSSVASSSASTAPGPSHPTYDTLRKSPLVTAEVVTATIADAEDRDQWTPLPHHHHRAYSVPFVPGSSIDSGYASYGNGKGKARVFNGARSALESLGSIGENGSAGDTLGRALGITPTPAGINSVPLPVQRDGPRSSQSARDLLFALHARGHMPQAAAQTRARVQSEAKDAMMTPSLLSRIRTRATSLRPHSLFSRTAAAGPSSLDAIASRDAMNAPAARPRRSVTTPAPPALIVTSPSTESHSNLPSPLAASSNNRGSASAFSEAGGGAMPALHPALAAVERSSRLLKANVACAVCGDTGKDFPRCGRCGEAWCSRDCRLVSLAGKKRHVCATSVVPANAALSGTLVTV